MHTLASTNNASKNVLILGASSDIGRALGEWLQGKVGYRVLLAARNKARQILITCEGNWKLIQDLDFLQDEDLARLRDVTDSYFEGPFSVIHCVGDYWCHIPLVDLGMSKVREMMDSHYITLCGIARVLLPLLMKRGGGRLLAFSCNSVAFNYPDMLPFTSAKAAVECAIKCIAHEYAPYGISALALALPTIRTQKVKASKGDSSDYMEPIELAEIVLGNLLLLPSFANGSVLKVFKPSPTFYTSSYFDRNPRSADSYLGVPGQERSWSPERPS